MKILHIIDSAGLYGAEVMLLNLAQEQKRLGHQPVIASIREKHEKDLQLEDEAERKGLEYLTFRMLDGPNFLGAWSVLRYARVNHFDVLHTHGYKGNILFGSIPKAIRKIPIVSTLHGWTNAGAFSKLYLYEYADSLTLRNMDAVCLVNNAMLKHPWLRGLNGRLRVIPNGIPPLESQDSFQEDDISEFCRQSYTIISIGRLSREKGYTCLIEAFEKFQRYEDNVRLLILGEGDERKLLEEIIKQEKLSDKVLLPGYKEKAWRYLKYCQVFVLFSMTEGLPITLLEAMQVGIPVIATAVGGIPELVKPGQTGCLVPPGDVKSLIMQLKELKRNELSSKSMTVKAKSMVNLLYSSERMAENYIQVYSKVVYENYLPNNRAAAFR